ARQPGKARGDDNPPDRQARNEDALVAIQTPPRVNSATPSVSKSVRLRYGNIDIAVTANGVSGDEINVYGMSDREGNT
ncbi:macrolide ABC transporter permease/ATP-binding protein MacB, partial [Salmonella enterica subsp. enterica serovar Infantis]